MKRFVAIALFAALLPAAAFAQQGRNQNNNTRRPIITRPARPQNVPRVPSRTAPVPEPSAALVFLVGLATAGYAVRRRS